MNATITLNPDNWLTHLGQIAAQCPAGDLILVRTDAQKELLERALVRLERPVDALTIRVIHEDEVQ